jgi:hypothetical protein
MFYIVERSDQLQQLKPFEDCFVRFIPKNDNFHPALTDLSLVYIKPLNGEKGYVLCINHSESFSLTKNEILNWLQNNINKIWVLDKKEALHWAYQLTDKLFDINLLEFVDLTESLNNRCISFYYSYHTNLPNLNCLIPISKQYQECESIFNIVYPIIKKYTPSDIIFQFNNFHTINVFYQIEKNGIKLDKHCFIDYYKNKIKYPEFSLDKGKVYTQYNLYTTTSRPSNTHNSINFAALKKDDGERLCYKPENDSFVEFDFQGYHPRLIGELIDFYFPKDRNTYEVLGELLGVTQQEAKELTFKQLYGGVWSEYRDKPFFKDVNTYIDFIWSLKEIKCENKIFTPDENITPNKLFNYIIQSFETSTNVKLLEPVLDYLKDKKTKLVLYTYDAFLFDYNKEDGEIFTTIKKMLQYPVNIKTGHNYHSLKSI